MAISRVEIRDLRNLESVAMDPGKGINVVAGPNGAGKTSVLEGIYLLGRGRSFRTSLAKPIIREGADCVEVVGKKEGPPAITAGIRRCATSTQIRINGANATRISELARLFPVQLVTPRSHELLERGPDLRRRFLDWGLFHVEPSYGGLVVRYNRVIKQRNEALKRDAMQAASWEAQIAEYGEKIHHSRTRHLEQLQESLVSAKALLGLDLATELSMARGWGGEVGLSGALRKRRSLDSQTGFTSCGPHRDDVRIHAAGSIAADRLSRGQQKLLVLGLILAQMELVSRIDGSQPVLLIDDLAAELDQASRFRVMAYLAEIEVQAFISTLDPGSLGDLPPLSGMFHVEQGRLYRRP